MAERDMVTRAMHRRLECSAGAGFALWCAWGVGLWAGVLCEDEPFAVIDWLTLLGPVCIVPLGLRIARRRIADAEWTGWRRLMWLQPVAAACAMLAFALPRGRWAAAIAIPWMFAAWTIARLGSKRFRTRTPTGLYERGFDVAFIYLLVGAFMTMIGRSGYTAFGLIEPILTLASTHFYFAGFALLVIGAELGRILREAASASTFARAWACAMACAIWGVMVSLAPIAAGVMASPPLELVGAVILAASGFTLGLVLAFGVAPRASPLRSAVLLAVAGLASMIATALGAAYAVSSYRGDGWPTQPVMIWIHGPLQGGVVALGGLLGLVTRRTRGEG